MTKKHVNALADAMRAAKPIQGIGMTGSRVNQNELVRLEQWKFDRDQVADVIAEGFDREQWLERVNQ